MSKPIDDKKKFMHLLHTAGLESLLGISLLWIITFAMHSYSAKEDNKYKISHEVLNHFLASKSQIDNNITTCLAGGNITRKNHMNRIVLRQELIKSVVDNRNLIPSGAYFTGAKFTRFDDAPAMANLCSLKKKDLIQIRNDLTDWEIAIQRELGI